MTCIPLLSYTKYGLRRYTLNAYVLYFYYGQNACYRITSEIKDYYYYSIIITTVTTKRETVKITLCNEYVKTSHALTHGREKMGYVGHIIRHNTLQHAVLEEDIEGRRRRRPITTWMGLVGTGHHDLLVVVRYVRSSHEWNRTTTTLNIYFSMSYFVLFDV